MGLTIESTNSNNVIRKGVTTIYNTAYGAPTSGITGLVKLFKKIINNTFFSNFLLFSCIRNPTYAIRILSGAKVKILKTTVLEMGITIEITTSNCVTIKCVSTIYNTANGALTSGISAFVQLFKKIINNNFFSNFFFFAVFEI